MNIIPFTHPPSPSFQSNWNGAGDGFQDISTVEILPAPPLMPGNDPRNVLAQGVASLSVTLKTIEKQPKVAITPERHVFIPVNSTIL